MFLGLFGSYLVYFEDQKKLLVPESANYNGELDTKWSSQGVPLVDAF